jgi:hypothetical protein
MQLAALLTVSVDSDEPVAELARTLRDVAERIGHTDKVDTFENIPLWNADGVQIGYLFIVVKE